MRKAGLIAMAMLGGCLGNSGVRPLRPLEIATTPYLMVGTTALTGSLMYQGGCLLFRDEQSGRLLMPIWPAGSTFNGTALRFHNVAKADQRVVIAEEVLINGQPSQWTTLGTAPYRPVQHQCGAYPPFYVTAVRPAN